MASTHQKGNGHSMFTNKSPHFFKIILQETLRDGKLGIPREFIKKYGNEMSSRAFLRVPSGEVWQVELRKRDGKVWLKNGWQEFSNHYFLEVGHFVVFRYEGNCNFHVIILDRTASEIEYPYTNNYHAQLKEIPEESVDDDSIEIIEVIPPSRKSRKKPNLPCHWPHKKMRSTNSANITETKLKSEYMASQAMHNGCPTIKGDKSTRSCHRIQTLKADKKSLAIQRAARAFKSENPFFVLVMQPSYAGLSQKCALVLPSDFVRKHLKQLDCEIILSNSNGKTWPVMFYQRVDGERLIAGLRTGWGTFVQDNNIRVGDVCVFELTNCIEISFKVVKYQGEDRNCHESSTLTDVLGPVKVKAGSSSPSQGRRKSLNVLQKAKALQLANAFKSENPSFTVVLQPSYVQTNRMTVPHNFAKRYFRKMATKMHHEVILRLSNGKSWLATYHQYSIEMPIAKICTGWRKFVLDNNLEVGDVCVFELIEGTEISFKVTIYKKQGIEDANLGASWARSRGNPGKIECKDGLEIDYQSNLVQNQGDMSSLQNQHLSEEFPVPKIEENNDDVSGEILDDFWLSEKKQLREKLESPSSLEKEQSKRIMTMSRVKSFKLH